MGWIRTASVRTQVILLLAAAPLVIALLGLSLAPMAVALALEAAPGDPTVAIAAVRATMSIAILCGLVAATGAAIVLRRSLRGTIGDLHTATSAIACGDFTHRIASGRVDELGGLAHAIDAMAVRLQHLDESRHRMLACVSHELRTPLTIMRGTVFTLARNECDPERVDRFGIIENESRRLAALIDDLIDVACLHAGGMRLERARCDLTERCRDAATRLKAEARGRDVALLVVERDRPGLALVDGRRIDQLVANLVTNAVRHATPGSTVRIEALGPTDGKGAALIVHNEGPTIGVDDRARIFEPFVQLGERAGRAGLGLAIARGIAQAHGGSLEVEVLAKAVGEAATVSFRFELPRHPDESGRSWLPSRVETIRSRARSRMHVEPLTPLPLQGRLT